MRKVLSAVGATLLFAGPALAADLAVKAPRAVPLMPVLTWDGWYIGANAGYAFNNNSNVDTVSTNTFAFPGPAGGPNLATAVTALSNFSAPAGKNSFIGGGQIGYNKQLSPMWVVGIEADIQGLADNSSTTAVASSIGIAGFPNTLVQSAAVSKEVDFLGTVRGRLGFLVSPSVLFYGTGGLAYGGVQASTSVAQNVTGVNALLPPTWSGAGSLSDTRVGWSAGGGVEWMFMPGWSAKAEYLHYDLGSATYSVSSLVSNAVAASPFTINTLQSKVSFTGDIVRAGINYHF